MMSQVHKLAISNTAVLPEYIPEKPLLQAVSGSDQFKERHLQLFLICGVLSTGELRLPDQEHTLTHLEMSAVERHFYSQQHEVS